MPPEEPTPETDPKEVIRLQLRLRSGNLRARQFFRKNSVRVRPSQTPHVGIAAAPELAVGFERRCRNFLIGLYAR